MILPLSHIWLVWFCIASIATARQLPSGLEWKAKHDQESKSDNRGHTLTPDEEIDLARNYRLLFRLIDVNRDGKISHLELYNFFNTNEN